MELDLHRNDGSILFSDLTELKTTNGMQTSVISSGYGEISGFKQLNSTHVVIVAYSYHCIKMINQEDRSNVTLAGTCGASGFEDGSPAKFKGPWGIEVDERNPGHLLITDHSNNALRSVDVTSATVSTVINSGFNYPRVLTWNNGRLLVCDQNYISEIIWSFE